MLAIAGSGPQTDGAGIVRVFLRAESDLAREIMYSIAYRDDAADHECIMEINRYANDDCVTIGFLVASPTHIRLMDATGRRKQSIRVDVGGVCDVMALFSDGTHSTWIRRFGNRVYVYIFVTIDLRQSRGEDYECTVPFDRIIESDLDGGRLTVSAGGTMMYLRRYNGFYVFCDQHSTAGMEIDRSYSRA